MGSTLPAVGASACHRASFHHRFAVLRATPPCTVAATASLRSGLQHAPAIFGRASACRSSGRFRYRHRRSADSRIMLCPLPGAEPSSSLRHPSHPQETSLDTFFVLRQKGTTFSACCVVSRALHLPKVFLAQFGFHRVHIPSLALPPPQPVEGFCLPFVGHSLHLRGRLSATAALRSPHSLRPTATVAAWHPAPAAPVRGKASILSACVFVHPCPGSGGNAAIPKILPHPVGVNRPGASRPGTLHASLLPSVRYCRGSSHRARVATTVAAGNGRQVTANTGSRPARRVLTRGHALRACPLFAPFPPRPPSSVRCRAPISGRNVWEGRGLRSLPAVFAGARPTRSLSLALTAVDCFPEPLHRGAAVLIGDTPRRTGAFRWLPISFGQFDILPGPGGRSPFGTAPSVAGLPPPDIGSLFAPAGGIPADCVRLRSWTHPQPLPPDRRDGSQCLPQKNRLVIMAYH